VGSPYADRVAECAAAERVVGPLRHATLEQARSINEPVVRARAMHVIGENQRVSEFAAALTAGEIAEAGRLMMASHASLRHLYQTSTPAMDAAVDELINTSGVHGARMTGGGFGGCVVALAEPGAIQNGWILQAVNGASTFEEE
jgi:galactokinase